MIELVAAGVWLIGASMAHDIYTDAKEAYENESGTKVPWYYYWPIVAVWPFVELLYLTRKLMDSPDTD